MWLVICHNLIFMYEDDNIKLNFYSAAFNLSSMPAFNKTANLSLNLVGFIYCHWSKLVWPILYIYLPRKDAEIWEFHMPKWQWTYQLNRFCGSPYRIIIIIKFIPRNIISLWDLWKSLKMAIQPTNLGLLFVSP